MEDTEAPISTGVSTDIPEVPDACPPRVVQKNDKYYFRLVVFSVDDTLFKVPRHHFEQDSSVFRDMFNLPCAEGVLPEGETDENPINLEAITKEEFFSFLEVICPKHFQSQPQLPLQGWIAVLKLSAMWEFKAARDLAILKLTPMTMNPIERIELAQACRVYEWHWIALFELAMPSQSFSSADAERLGFDFSLRVAELRGQVTGFKKGKGVSTLNSSGGADYTEDNIASFILELFRLEVANVSYYQCSPALKEFCRQVLLKEKPTSGAPVRPVIANRLYYY
ncbi:hypothetical protein H0H92_005518 [Tricholoma furcatifolium]|nr:hypothetical protein H0H92_005518 [Tricholoma furcatifolium]